MLVLFSGSSRSSIFKISFFFTSKPKALIATYNMYLEFIEIQSPVLISVKQVECLLNLRHVLGRDRIGLMSVLVLQNFVARHVGCF
ncbi:hypothetical protein AX774_g1240 [Zancudomyces culisetae]|uniref:Uncharacterized protein n=1 Tax=Zancudomyces culisetae TaxID=1213189 RepID=A0A1R1PW67_ZANCU|nr:hypothetical protein AX774_g1240 [Zancudomyces culisetae]|eukprot:OMH85216.1 hypothetical protein AX774_g1240 [Zancudomyces culisetae]